MILGLDMSLRGTAMVVLPSTWEPGNWNTLATYRRIQTVGLDLMETMDRIIHAIIQCVEDEQVQHVFIEQHAFIGFQKGALPRVELVGAVKFILHQDYGLKTQPIIASQARKLIFGKLPRMKRPILKKYIIEQMTKMGAPFAENDDLCDALVIANYGLSELGLPCLAQS
jgi:Holliday junction resolvasome RuvABC endonuclease subunit